MASIPLFDPTCPWKASCKSRKITTGAGLLRHLQRFHKLGDAGWDDWVSQLRYPAEYRKLEAILRATSSWLCTTCFKTHSLGVLSCATNPATCQRLWNLEDGLVPPDVNLLPGLPRPAPPPHQPPQDTSEPQGRLHSQPRGRPRASAAVADPPPSAPPARVRRHPLTPATSGKDFVPKRSQKGPKRGVLGPPWERFGTPWDSYGSILGTNFLGLSH
eukprot:jgi/Botrbrau1/6387/Bobra.49_1s0005.1